MVYFSLNILREHQVGWSSFRLTTGHFSVIENATWQKHALYGVQLFKQNNVLYQYDAWYQQFVKQCCGIAEFQEYWEKAREATRQENAPTKIFLARMATTGELLPIRVRHMLVSVSSKIYPAVSALLPVDEAARAVYASFGSVTSWPSSVG